MISALALLIFGVSAAPTPDSKLLQNITIAVPEGSTNHGNKEILCTPAQWEDILVFFLVNYVAHALTVVVLPGEGPVSHLTNALTSLLFPAFGAYRGLRAIFVGYETIKKKFGDQSSEEEQDLRKARRAGALCMIVRSSDWVPRDGDEIHENVLRVQPHEPSASASSAASGKHKKDGVYVTEHEVGSSTVDDDQGLLAGTSHIEISSIAVSDSTPEINLHTYPVPWTYSRQECPDTIGSRTVRCAPSDLEPGYSIIMLPPCTPVRELPQDDATDRIASAYDSIKVLVALGQAILAIRTLYQTRGNQIDRYGYASFGLTVAPYAIMSIINLLGALSRPDYDAVYLVGSPTMIEERRRKGLDGYYDGIVGEVYQPDTTIHLSKYSTADGMSFVESPVKFESTVDGLYARYKSSTLAEETLVKVNTSQPPSFPLQKQSLFIPSMAPIAYNRRDPTRLDAQLLSNNPYALDKPRWPQRILPRSTRYLERSRSLSFLISLTPLIPIGVLSHFRAGESTRLQRAITMLWLAWGSFIGYLVAEFGKKDTVGVKVKGRWKASSIAGRAVWMLLAGSPAVAGMVVVGSMLKEYGTCIKLPGM
ncbi:uncharacterized protein K441DRAFT_670173 [Cenococcum geophilum 1.58]|uniref:Uncharacterized protein n=1 Tax=Cenococcum geophilum 1.58 TaxID=794803 RepID=A0ACC8EQC6_9PEZI|nr:hypothetical protein K441DRAFT_670173 [Cenococcum geophilum 1.58]